MQAAVNRIVLQRFGKGLSTSLSHNLYNENVVHPFDNLALMRMSPNSIRLR
jgi:hypothetical protein